MIENVPLWIIADKERHNTQKIDCTSIVADKKLFTILQSFPLQSQQISTWVATQFFFSPMCQTHERDCMYYLKEF